MNEEIQQPQPEPTDSGESQETLAAEHNEELASEDELTAVENEESAGEPEPATPNDESPQSGNEPDAGENDESPANENESGTGENEESPVNETESDTDRSEAPAGETAEASDSESADEFPAELELAASLDLPPILEMFDEETGEAKFSEIIAEEDAAKEQDESAESAAEDSITATREELKPVIESLLFVADEPLPFKQLCKVLGEVPEEDVRAALEELVADYEARNSGLEIREIAGGWRLSTRPQNHEFIRKYLKSRPSARLSLPALETLAVIAYKQPVTIPEILEIRGVSSSSAIKTLLEKRLIVTKGRKETVGRPMMYGTSKEFLIQFGLKDLNELPSFEDFEDLMQ